MTTLKTTNDDQWVEEFASAERRRNMALGAAVLAAIVIVSIAIVAYFASAAAIAW